MIPLAQNPLTNFKNIFFILNYTTPLVITGFEQLSSSICCRIMAGQVCPERANYAFSGKFWIRPKTGFLTHNFGYRYASKAIKGSIDVDFDQVFNKTLSLKNGSMGWGPGPAKISKTCVLCDVTSRNPPTEKEKRFCSMSTRRLAESVDGLDSSLA